MFAKKHFGLGLFAALVAILAMAFSAASASATKVTEPGEEYNAANVGNTAFLPENAYAETSVQCEASEAAFVAPTEAANNHNMNRGPAEGVVGEFSTGPGSVLMVFKAPPTFTECAVYVRAGGAWVNSEIGAVVTTNETNGAWTVAALGRKVEEVEVDEASFGVPKAGAKIEIPELGCAEVISPVEATSVAAPRYVNATSRLTVDGQINANGGCGFEPPAQFEATYEVTPAGAGGPFEIHP